jgi:hypothetical protein
MARTATSPSLGAPERRSLLRGLAEQLASALARRRPVRESHVALDATRAWSLEAGRSPVEIVVREGEVMVTFEADPEDHVLGRGEAFRTTRSGRVAVAAFRPSRFSVAAG